MQLSLDDFRAVGLERLTKQFWNDAELLMYIDVTQCVAAYYGKSEVGQLALMELRSLEHMATARGWSCGVLGNGFVKWKPVPKV